MALNHLINIYRSLESREYKDTHGYISGTMKVNSDRIEWLRAVEKDDLIDELEQGDEVELGVDDINHDLPIKVDIKVPRTDGTKFYKGMGELLRSSSIRSGTLPCGFYLIDEDVAYPESQDDPDANILQLEKLCHLIQALIQIAPYHDKKLNDSPNLVFLARDETAEPIVLTVDVDEDMLEADLSDLSLLNSFLAEEAKLEAHYTERLTVLFSSMHELTKGLCPREAFKKLVKEWPVFARLFQNNLNTYLSGFTFHKAKKEVVEEELKLSNELASVTNDITGKLLSVPVSVAAVVLMGTKSDSAGIDLIILVGLIVTFIISLGMVLNQGKKLRMVRLAKELVDKSIQGDVGTYPEDLKKSIKDMKNTLQDGVDSAEKWLLRFGILSFIPVPLGLAVFLMDNWDALIL